MIPSIVTSVVMASLSSQNYTQTFLSPGSRVSERKEGGKAMTCDDRSYRTPACVAIWSLWEAGGSYIVQLKQAMGQGFQGVWPHTFVLIGDRTHRGHFRFRWSAIIGASLSKSHTSGRAPHLQDCIGQMCVYTTDQPCLRPYTVNFKRVFKYFP